MKWLLQILFLGIYSVLYAQNIDADLMKAKEYFLKKRYLLRVKENLSKFAPAFE